jgi:hypothetical protein
MATKQQSTTDYIDHLVADAEADQHNLVMGDPDDETEFDVRQRERAEAWAAEMRTTLASVRSRRRLYRAIALRWHSLPAAPLRVLCYYLEKADADLDNVFPERKTVAAALGLAIKTYDHHVRWLHSHGWIKRHEFRRGDGTQSSSGIQLGIPFVSGAWWGPATFSKRQGVIPRRRFRPTPQQSLNR